MKLVGIARIRNEADVIEAFVRYHVQCLDELVVIDHRSVDASPEILRQLQDEGLPLEVRRDQTPWKQVDSMTKAMRDSALNRHADWIVPLDADEFLHAKGGRTVRGILADTAPDTVLRVNWQTYLPSPLAGDPSSRNVLERLETRLASEPTAVHKVLVPGSIAKRRGTTLRMGNHYLVRSGLWSRKRFPLHIAEGLHLAHFPVRSASQIRQKVLVGWLATLAKPNRRKSESKHWQALYERFRRQSELSSEDLIRIALSYTSGDDEQQGEAIPETVRDPVRPEGDWPFELRYTPPPQDDLFGVILQVAEEFAESLGSLRR